MKLRVVRADPAGNITLFVLSAVARGERAATAAKLMAAPAFAAEQVGFVCPPRHGGDGRFEMMGGEFCGNAARAFGMLMARERGVSGRARVMVETSGCGGVIAVDVDAAAGTARAEMPLPRFVRAAESADVQGTLVHLGGIAHLVVGRPPDAALFGAAEALLMREGELAGLDAYGVVFLHGGRLTPLVKVVATDTLVWEGSCGSGALAAALAESASVREGGFARDYVQPAGVVRAEVEKKGGAVVSAHIGGGVTVGGAREIEIGKP